MAGFMFSRALCAVTLVFSAIPAIAQSSAIEFSRLFEEQVSRKVELNPAQVQGYAQALHQALSSKPQELAPQFYVVVDRNPQVQVLSLFLGTSERVDFIGATPVSTGTTGRFDYYVTPTGVFEHSLQVDFRAEGSRNKHGIRGYGAKGMRIWDLGWFPAVKGWKKAKGERGEIRFQIHATDPDVLEPKLGAPGSKGCIRIPASLNKYMDKYGVLDGAYDAKVHETGKTPWAWAKDHVQTSFSGKYLVVLDSRATASN